MADCGAGTPVNDAGIAPEKNPGGRASTKNYLGS
jgi:hypothetical protein